MKPILVVGLLMGAVAGRLSDVIIVTSDNPRSEDPARIIDDVLRGITPDTRRPGGEPSGGGHRAATPALGPQQSTPPPRQAGAIASAC